MKLIRIISIFLAGIILFLHSVMPHEHHTQFNAQEHLTEQESVQNLWEYLKLAFHLDQGEEHLEKYRSAENSLFVFSAILSSNCSFSTSNRVIEFSFHLPGYFSGSYSKLLVSSAAFRGPPFKV